MAGLSFYKITASGFLKVLYIYSSVTPFIPNYIGIHNANIANIAIPNEKMSAL
jgi:hypothetical protein